MYSGLSSSSFSFYSSYGEFIAEEPPVSEYNYAQHSGPFYRLSTQQLGQLSFPASFAPFPIPENYVGVDVVVVYVGTIELDSQIKKVPMVARVTIIDYWGNIILDTYVRPTHNVEDYRTQETGLQPNDLIDDVQLRVADIIKNKILVGHSLWTFLSVLGLSHPALYTRDLALFRPLRKRMKSKLMVSLPTLVRVYLRRDVGMGYEDSLEVTRAEMDLFRCCEHIFEQIIRDGAWPCNLPPTGFAGYFT